MQENNNNNALLDTLINNARNISAGVPGSLTPERFFLAVIDYLHDETADKTPEKETIYKIVSSNVDNIDLMRKYLSDFVSSQSSLSFPDQFYMMDKMLDLQIASSNDSDDEITPEMLLEKIFRDPPTSIKAFLKNSSKESDEYYRPDDVAKIMRSFIRKNREKNGALSEPEIIPDNDGEFAIKLGDLTDSVRQIRKTLLKSVLAQ